MLKAKLYRETETQKTYSIIEVTKSDYGINSKELMKVTAEDKKSALKEYIKIKRGLKNAIIFD